ncbi:all-trans-nonaprenyl-diphosphate synthase (geranyl-diphosphate specific) [Anaplasma platys]|uniref:All-trans-nonaprenyl-diphosphate synthase (Geranyl-diphosphate specific) n=1 Tax=Anaplasma platys TaxID=949 RepID=A0A858PZ71_9RICK|nr:polyprenyl synthetase family protein [Anaplasma platys]QJC27916.1 all-trans-nonaprenyl-diphosphate synthase (geranyl-diphosphate specific) [Anaplasma platys]
MYDNFANALNDLRILVAEEFSAMESFITHNSNSGVEYISNIIKHLVLSGGKRTRPLLHLAACGLLECTDKRRIAVAAAIECIHSATLLHDDVVDKSDLRRGVRTANSIWGNKASILVGDFLFAVSFQWIVGCNNLPVLSILSGASSVIITGEIQQMVHSEKIDISQQKYLEIISAKTAVLFSAACEAAAALADAPAFRKPLRSFGNNFGIAFQILDDILDYTARSTETGKATCNDILQGKVTLPLIVAYENADAKTRAAISNELAKPSPNAEVVCAFIKELNAIEKSVEIAKHYAYLAMYELDLCPDSKFKTALKLLLHSATNRRF